MMAAQSAPFLPELKPGGSDYNLFWSYCPSEEDHHHNDDDGSGGGRCADDLNLVRVFPGGLNLSECASEPL